MHTFYFHPRSIVANWFARASFPCNSSSSHSAAIVNMVLLLKPPPLSPGTSSHRSSKPSLMRVRRFCSLRMWFSLFCSSDRFSRGALDPLADGLRLWLAPPPDDPASDDGPSPNTGAVTDVAEGGGELSLAERSAFGFLRLGFVAEDAVAAGVGVGVSSPSNGSVPSRAFLLFLRFRGGASGSSFTLGSVCACPEAFWPWCVLVGLLGRVLAALLETSRDSKIFICSLCIESIVVGPLFSLGVYPCTGLKLASDPHWKSFARSF